MVGLLVLAPVALGVLVVVHDILRRPGLRRLALRNATRRPGEAALVVVGCLLGTAIITSAFLVGDTFEESVRDVARRELGPVDVRASARNPSVVPVLEELYRSAPLDESDGRLLVTTSTAAVTDGVIDGGRAEASARILAADVDAARTFGEDGAATGLAEMPAPRPSEALIGGRLAEKLGVVVGDPIAVHAYGQERRFAVVGITPEIGFGGYADVIVAPDVLAGLAMAAPVGAATPTTSLLVSGRGGIYDGAAHTAALVADLEERLAGADGVEVRGVKEDLLDGARAEGDGFRQLFLGVGSFSVLVGILLLVNLFVMLAEERKSELGMARAVGLKRGHLLRTFSIEGALYAAVASVLGAIAGIAVGWVIASVTEGILTADQPDFRIVFAVKPASVITGMVVGFSISLITAWATSARIARLNVIRAIREIPDPPAPGGRRRVLVASVLGVLFGGATLAAGVAGQSRIPALAGLPIALFSGIPLLRVLVGSRRATAAMATASLVWGVGVFSLLPETMQGSGIEVFVVQGVVLIGAAVMLASMADGMWTALTSVLVNGGRGLASRLALAYPLARRVRTGLLLAMFSLTIFTMTFMAVIGSMFESQAETFADLDRGGFDLLVASNATNPLEAASLAGTPGVAAVAPLQRGFPQFTADGVPEPTHWPATGFGPELVAGGPPILSTWAPEYGTSEDVYAAVLNDPSLVIVPDHFLLSAVGPAASRVGLGDEVVMHDVDSDRRLALTIVGVSDADFVGNGAMVASSVLVDVLGSDAFGGRFYASVQPDVDPTDLASRINGSFVAAGADARVFIDDVEAQLAQQAGFFSLLQGYLGLGLLIGVAGLGVVMVRAARERRREVGMLRALGLPAVGVRSSFLLEAAFVAVQGAAIGVGLGMIAAYQTATNSDTFGDTPLPFTVPWGIVAAIFLVPVFASLAATVTPAIQASRIRPAAALRIAD